MGRMSEQNFEKQREKWERWLKERQKAKNAEEPLLVFVDDDEFQRNMRYYEMRLQKHPGRNILLFENAAEAVEFIRFASEKQLYLGAVVSDFDNYPVSTTKGSQVLEAAIEYGKTRNHPVVKLLISSIPRPLSADDPLNSDFDTLEDAEKKERLEDIEANKNLDAFNKTPEAQSQGIVLTHKKNDKEIEEALLEATIQSDKDAENHKLIPELIYSMNMIDALLNKFFAELEPYKSLSHSSDGTKPKAIAKLYKPLIKSIERSERSIEDMLKIWALVKDFEQTEVVRLGGAVSSPNEDADEPEDPLNVRILGNLFLDECKRIHANLQKHSHQAFVFAEISSAIRANKHFGSDENERAKVASKVTHNLKGPILAIFKQVGQIAKKIENYIDNPPTTLMREPEEGEYRFTHDALRRMAINYRLGDSRPSFYYVPASSANNDNTATVDRTENTPGEKAPSRETIVCPMNEAEKEGARVVKKIQKGLLDQLLRIIEADQKNRDKMTVTGQDIKASLGALMNILKQQLTEKRGGKS